MPRGFLCRLIGPIVLALPAIASAGELGDFHRLVAEAYASYRSAMFYLRTGNPGVAALELDAASDGWAAVVERFGEAPPDAFHEDPVFLKSLESVGASLRAGQEAIDADDIDRAGEQLAAVRRDLSDLRRRNGMRLFGDCIDDMNREMDRLWAFRHEPPA